MQSAASCHHRRRMTSAAAVGTRRGMSARRKKSPNASGAPICGTYGLYCVGACASALCPARLTKGVTFWSRSKRADRASITCDSVDNELSQLTSAAVQEETGGLDDVDTAPVARGTKAAFPWRNQEQQERVYEAMLNNCHTFGSRVAGFGRRNVVSSPYTAIRNLP